MKAVRFSLSPDEEEGACEEFGGSGVGLDEEERSYIETVSRSGSQQHLAECGTGRETANKQKAASPFSCGLCCSKAPAVSVWNCDGEILTATEILCR